MNQNEIITELRAIFSSVLKELSDDFSNDASFLELGGASMDAMKIQMEIRRTFCKKISIETLYELGSVIKIAQVILQ